MIRDGIGRDGRTSALRGKQFKDYRARPEVAEIDEPLPSPEVLAGRWFEGCEFERVSLTAMLLGDPEPARAAKREEPLARTLEAIRSLMQPPTILHPVAALKRGQCRFPLGEIGTKSFKFCSATRTADSSYCETHYLLSYRGRTRN